MRAARTGTPSSRRRALVTLVVCAGVLAMRLWGVTEHFWLLRDQTRDWAIVLGTFADLPLVGPATHVDGYTIGPAFYWILWGLRHLFGPLFEDLPHAGGIAQAVLQTAVDGGLLLAIWKRTQSGWVAVLTAVLVMTASYDLSLASLIWNPTMGSTLAKLSIALVIADWYRGSAFRAMLTVAVAWMAVHAYTGAIFVTVTVCAIVVLEPLLERDVRRAGQRALLALAAIAALQLPYVLHQFRGGFSERAMGAVTDSVGAILSGHAAPAFAASFHGYFAAMDLLQLRPSMDTGSVWMLAGAAAVCLVRRRDDPVLLVLCLLPQVLALVGFAFFLGGLDHYYYLSLMTPAVLTVTLAIAALVPRSPAPAKAIGPLLCAGVLALVPDRYQHAQMGHRLPEYGRIVRASRVLAHRRQPLRGIDADFPLPPTTDLEIVFRILGGTFDPASPWTAVISRDGAITYRRQEP